MPTIQLHVDCVGELLSQVASAYLEQANPSLLIAKMAILMYEKGEPTVADILNRVAQHLAHAEANGQTIALSADHFSYTAFVSHDDATVLSQKGF